MIWLTILLVIAALLAGVGIKWTYDFYRDYIDDNDDFIGI